VQTVEKNIVRVSVIKSQSIEENDFWRPHDYVNDYHPQTHPVNHVIAVAFSIDFLRDDATRRDDNRKSQLNKNVEYFEKHFMINIVCECPGLHTERDVFICTDMNGVISRNDCAYHSEEPE